MLEDVYVVDDNDEFRESLTWLLESMDYECTGITSAEAMLETLERTPLERPAIALVDVRMHGMTGLQLQQQLVKNKVDLAVVIMTGHGDIPMAVSAMQAGAVSFIEKPFRQSALAQALAQAAARCEELRHATAAVENGTLNERQERWTSRLQKLTPREQEVLKHVCQGRLNKLIADDLQISIKTVELHRSRVMQKLEAKSISDLIRMVERGEVV